MDLIKIILRQSLFSSFRTGRENPNIALFTTKPIQNF
jgi:hypothetical protein